MISPTKKVMLIAGMHRSGTSLITQWLHKCGLQVGNELMSPSVSNEQGYFEDLDFVNAHIAIFQNLKMKTSGLALYNIDDIGKKNTDELKKIIAQKNREQQEWGWKDPRTCLFLNTYDALIPDAFYLVVFRDFEATVSSLITRHYKESEQKYKAKKGISKWLWENYKKPRRIHSLCRKYATYYLKVWIHYNNKLLNHLQALPTDRYLVVHSNLLETHDLEVFLYLTGTWGFSLHYYPFNNVYTKTLCSNKINLNPYIKDKQLIDQAKELQQQLQYYSGVEATSLLKSV